MAYDPLWSVIDAPLTVSDDTMGALIAFRGADKFEELLGDDTTVEQERLTSIFNAALDRVIAGLQSNPRKQWVMAQIQPALLQVAIATTDSREHFGTHVEKLMDILGIESSDGMLNFYLVCLVGI